MVRDYRASFSWKQGKFKGKYFFGEPKVQMKQARSGSAMSALTRGADFLLSDTAVPGFIEFSGCMMRFTSRDDDTTVILDMRQIINMKKKAGKVADARVVSLLLNSHGDYIDYGENLIFTVYCQEKDDVEDLYNKITDAQKSQDASKSFKSDRINNRVNQTSNREVSGKSSNKSPISGLDMSAIGEQLDPNKRIIKKTQEINRNKIYSALRDAFMDTGIEIDNADLAKGGVKGFILGNKKKPFDAYFKFNDRANMFGIKLDHKISLKNIERRDIRDLDEDKYEEVFLVKFWDAFYNNLGLGEAPGFGDKSRVELGDEGILSVMAEYFKKSIQHLFNTDDRLKKIVKGINANQQQIKQKYKWEFKSIELHSQWKQELIYAIEIFLDESKQVSAVISANSFDIRTFEKVPVQINLFLVLPRAVERDLDMSYKCVWSSPEFDDVSQKMLAYMNYELTLLQARMKKLFELETTYHIKFEENILEKGKKSKIKYDHTLANLINIFPVNNPLADEETSVLLLRYLLKINDDNSYDGYLPVSDCIFILNELFKEVKKYFVATEEDLEKQRKIEEELEREKQQKEAGELKRCPKCSWLLSAGTLKCPMCGADTSSIEKKEKLGMDLSDFNTSSSLHGAKEKAYADSLMSSFDQALDDWGDPETKRANVVKENFKDAFKEIRKYITNIITTEDEIKSVIGPVFRANNISYKREKKTLWRFLIELKGLNFQWIYVVLDRLEMIRDEIFPVVVHYTIVAPYNHHKYSFVKELGKKKAMMEWQIDVGKDPDILIALNKTSEDFVRLLKDTYSGESTTQFIEPLFNEKGKIIGDDVTIDLYPVIRVEPFLDDKSNPRTIVIMRQFLDFRQQGFMPVKRVLKILNSIYSIIEIFKEEYDPNSSSKKEFVSEVKNTMDVIVDSQDLSYLDKKIQQSKYTYKGDKDEGIKITGVAQPIENPFSKGTDFKGLDINDDLNLDDDFDLGNNINLDDDLELDMLGDDDSDDELDALLGGTTVKPLGSETDYRSKTTFIKFVPPGFYIDSNISKSEANSSILQREMEIKYMQDMVKNEINAYSSGIQEDYNWMRQEVEKLIKQIREKQAELRAYEYELHRVKPVSY